MQTLSRTAPWLLALVLLAGCASTKVTSHQPYAGAALERPDRIIIEDFGATPRDVSTDSALTVKAAAATPQTAEDVRIGQELGAAVAKQLAADLREMGLPAVQAAGQPPPRPGDIVIRGNFYAIDEGQAGSRVLVGFGSGAAELKTAVEGYQMTPQGLRRLGSGETDSAGGKSPGLLLSVGTAAATANPLGLIVATGVKLRREQTGANTIEGAAKRTADEIAARLKVAAEKQGWI